MLTSNSIRHDHIYWQNILRRINANNKNKCEQAYNRQKETNIIHYIQLNLNTWEMSTCSPQLLLDVMCLNHVFVSHINRHNEMNRLHAVFFCMFFFFFFFTLIYYSLYAMKIKAIAQPINKYEQLSCTWINANFTCFNGL